MRSDDPSALWRRAGECREVCEAMASSAALHGEDDVSLPGDAEAPAAQIGRHYGGVESTPRPLR